MERLKREIYDLSSIVDGSRWAAKGNDTASTAHGKFWFIPRVASWDPTHFFRHTFNEMGIDLLISKRKFYKYDLSKIFAIEALLERLFIFF